MDDRGLTPRQQRDLAALLNRQRLQEVGRELARRRRETFESHATTSRRIIRMRDAAGNEVEVIEELGQLDQWEGRE